MERLIIRSKEMTRRDFAAQIVCCGVGLAVVAAGCGGGASSSRAAPSQTTRSKVLALHDVAVREVTQSGFQSQGLAFARNSSSSATPPVAADNGAETDTPFPSPTMPLLGAFIRNVAAKSPSTRRAWYLCGHRAAKRTIPVLRCHLLILLHRIFIPNRCRAFTSTTIWDFGFR